ncbi:hypothetical protein BDW42DRAFT_169210 [Aspergillus taichungensis]|uniref:DUF6606 domain-containing protein n=1 Tax=Aspergillus taichungensis TaxID=482145 RepID=A0A2J5HVC0_9EURO|nr:hypothetical protein BDW42DRAFT_169210 [Aspergillus taichungensis]
MIFAIQQLRWYSTDDVAPTWRRVAAALKSGVVMDENRAVDEKAILDGLENLKPKQTVLLYLKEQNAALLVRRTEHDTVNFEAFEASPPSEVALAAKGALEWDFPTIAVSLPLSKFQDPCLQETLAKFLAMADVERLGEFAAKTRKAGVVIAEEHDTTDPALITEFLMTILEVNGTPDCPPLLRKRVKDDVCWENAKIPWRRFPFWLVLRLSVQRLLCLELGAEMGMLHYKFLMCSLLARLLLDSADKLNPHFCHLKAKLCRRLAKLETYKKDLTPSSFERHRHLYGNTAPFCQKATDAAKQAINARWSSFKEQAQRRIPHLPFRARENDFRLTLPNSRPYFTKLFANTQDRTKPLQNDNTTLEPAILKNHRNKDLNV